MSGARALKDTPVVILAGGLGTRLRSVLPDLPKGLAPVGDQAFLDIQISLLRDQGARQFVLCVGHMSSQIHDCLGDGSRLGVVIEYSYETDTLLGTGGALRLADRFFKPRALVLNGDTYLAADYTQILKHHLEVRRDPTIVATLTVSRLEDVERYGTVVLDSTEGRVTGFREKVRGGTGPGWLNAGAYVIERELLERVPRGVPCSLERDVFPAALEGGMKIAAHRCQQPFFDIGTAEAFQQFRQLYSGALRDRPAVVSRATA
jgi:NDP-sugar pyrophosphorylase family protein